MLRQSSEEARIVAVLHDVVEDGAGWSFDRLHEEGFSEAIIDGVKSVTKRPEEEGDESKYMTFVRRAIAHPIGRSVKLADLEDNCDLARITNPTEADFNRIEKYRRAIAEIQAVKVN
jgi:(p)ppGpp synthase/HD superfamily hydrolase